jgi:hypothetical protein
VSAGSLVVDAGIGGGLSIRLVDPPPDALVQVRSETGGLPGESLDPVMTIKFVEHLDHGPLRMLGLSGDAFGFDGVGFYLPGGRGGLARIDLGSSDEFDVVVERRVGRIPLLVPLLGIRLLARDRVLLHASTFLVNDRAVVATAWASGGKSELLLAFMDHGARYVADEWTMIDGGGRITGLCSDLHVWDWQLRQMPELAASVSAAERRRLGALRAARTATRGAARLRRRGSIGRSLHQLDGWVRNAARVRLTPEAAYPRRVAREPVIVGALLLASVAAGPLSASVTDAATVVARMTASLDFERSPLLRTWAQYRYAFPTARNTAIEEASRMERDILMRALAHVPATEIVHPFPPSLDELYAAAREVVGRPAEA